MPSEPNLTLPLLLAGAAAALTGLFRLSGLGLRRMPRLLGAAVLVVGVAVGGLGLVLPRLGGADPAPGPRIPLEPAEPPETTPGTADGSGTISGVVRTADGEPVEETAVTLRRFRRTEEVETLEATTDPGGTFAFTELAVAPDVAYTVEADHRGATFASDLVFLGPHGASTDVELVVSPPTEDADALSVDVDSTVLVGDTEGIQVVQIVGLTNETDRAFVGPVRLPVLEGAAGLVPRRGLVRTRLSTGPDELLSRAPVLPGRTEVVYEYGLPAPTDARTIDRRVRYPTGRLDVLVAGELVVRDAAGLSDEGEVRLGTTGEERPYRRYSAAGLEPGDTVAPTVGIGPGGDALGIVLVGLGALTAVALLVFPLLRRRRSPGEPAEGRDTAEPAAITEGP